jgi:beta-lactamase regulating signal transducer with metallopeptidase domain
MAFNWLWLKEAFSAAERLGVFSICLLIVVAGFAIGLAHPKGGMLKGFNKILDTIMKYKNEKRRIGAQVEREQEKRRVAIAARKRTTETKKEARK